MGRLRESDHTWTFTIISGRSTGTSTNVGAGSVTLTNEFDGIQVNTVSGTDTFDSGSTFHVVARKYT